LERDNKNVMALPSFRERGYISRSRGGKALVARASCDRGNDRDTWGAPMRRSLVQHVAPITVCAVAGVLTACAGARAPVARVPFSQGFFEPTMGRVGYHMVSEMKWHASDEPTPRCVPTSSGNEDVNGTPPPGLAYDQSNLEFEGTPRQAGDWSVRVTTHGMHCGMGPDQQNYGDRTITINFHIDP